MFIGGVYCAQEHAGELTSVILSSNGHYIITGKKGDGHQLGLWDIAGGEHGAYLFEVSAGITVVSCISTAVDQGW